MAVDADTLKDGMRFWATGVTVVTSHHEDVRHGMTVSSFTSLSVVPPLVLISLERSARTCRLVQESGVFGVTILAAEQQAVSRRFAGEDTEYRDRFQDLETYTLVTGVPLLEAGLVNFDCRVSSSFESGTNMIFIGEVAAVKTHSQGKPLLYYNRAYQELRD